MAFPSPTINSPSPGHSLHPLDVPFNARARRVAGSALCRATHTRGLPVAGPIHGSPPDPNLPLTGKIHIPQSRVCSCDKSDPSEKGHAVGSSAAGIAAYRRAAFARPRHALSEAVEGERLDGIYLRRMDLISGRFAVLERSRDFTLVPWRFVLERRLGHGVSGLMREDGVNWAFGRGRGSLTIS